MNRVGVRRAALAAVVLGAMIGLRAREDGADDLSRVPPKAQAVVTVKVAEVWNSELGKQLRGVLEKMVAGPLAAAKKAVGLTPDDIQRLTVVYSEIKPEAEPVVIFRLKKAVGREAIAKVLGDGASKDIDGEQLTIEGGRAALVSADGKTVVVGTPDAVKALMASKGKPTGAMADMIAKAGKHAMAGYIDPTEVAKLADKLPPELAAAKAVVVAKDGVMWMDVGYTSTLGVKMTFADDKAAARARKTIDGVRALGSLALAGLGEKLAGDSKPIAQMLKAVETSLDDGKVEAKGTTVEAGLALTVEKDAVAGAVKEALEKVVIASARMQGTNNLKQLGLGMHNYHDVNGHLARAIVDKAGKPLLSWRVAILPYVDQADLYKQFKLDEPWDSAHNKKLIAKMPVIYAVPASKASVPGGTYYQVFTGKEAMFENATVRLADITDGLSNTLMIVEAAKDVPWTKPEDVTYKPEGDLPKLGGHSPNGFNALYGDGSVRFLSDTIVPATLKAMITRSGGEVVKD